jgi:dUTP pyrophosphatase
MNKFKCRICGCENYVFFDEHIHCCDGCGVYFKDPWEFTLQNIKFKFNNENAILPEKSTIDSVGYDLFSCEEVTIPKGETKFVNTGFSVDLPRETEMQIRSRSGMAKKGYVVMNQPGTVDPDYRGPVKVMLHNFTNEDYTVSIGDRIAQALFAPKLSYDMVITDELSDTTRGQGGFGSTGK